MEGREGWPPRWPDITDQAVRAALAATPRHLFVPPELRDQAYEDIALPIGQGQTISQPYIVALMTQALRLTPDSRVLEVGTGSGYQTAILAHITAHVWSVEVLPELARAAGERLRGLGWAHDVQIKVGDGSLGWPKQAPYDAIIVTAAGSEIPPVLVQQLAPGGRLVMPVGGSAWDQTLWLVEKGSGNGPDETLRAERLAEVRFVPLVAGHPRSDPDPTLAALRRRLRELLSA
jgi:protein-L-isoaspartate(D-aspartate) O-methyltransferase